MTTPSNPATSPDSPFRGLVAADRLRELQHMSARQLRQVLALPDLQVAVREQAAFRLHKLLEQYRVEHYQGTSSTFWRVKQAPSWITVANLPTRDACLLYLADHGCDQAGNLLKDPDPASPPALPSVKSKKPKPAPPAWHAEATDILAKNFAAIHASLFDATRRAVWFGALLSSIKLRGKQDGSIPHGRFLPWLKAHVPDLPDRTAREWMTASRRAFEVAKSPFLPFQQPDPNRPKLPICHGGELPKKVEAVLSGKTKHALFLEWKQAQSDDDDGLVPKIGRAKGEGGRPPEPTGTIQEIVAANLKRSIRLAGKADETLTKLGVDFLAWNDGQCTAFLSSLDRTTQCLRTWLNTPAEKRDMAAIAKLWKSL